MLSILIWQGGRQLLKQQGRVQLLLLGQGRVMHRLVQGRKLLLGR